MLNFIKKFRGKNIKKVVALTFDDGPNATTATSFILAKYKDKKATFFITKAKILIKRMKLF